MKTSPCVTFPDETEFRQRASCGKQIQHWRNHWDPFSPGVRDEVVKVGLASFKNGMARANETYEFGMQPEKRRELLRWARKTVRQYRPTLQHLYDRKISPMDVLDILAKWKAVSALWKPQFKGLAKLRIARQRKSDAKAIKKTVKILRHWRLPDGHLEGDLEALESIARSIEGVSARKLKNWIIHGCATELSRLFHRRPKVGRRKPGPLAKQIGELLQAAFPEWGNSAGKVAWPAKSLLQRAVESMAADARKALEQPRATLPLLATAKLFASI